MSRQIWDVIVVGTGPSGAVAAYELARNGCRTLLLEKEKLPRYKTCGGGLVRRSWNALPFSISEVVEREIKMICLTNNLQDAVLIEKKDPCIAMTMRSSLDQFLTYKAIDSGAQLRQNTKVTKITESRDSVECVTDSGSYESSFLIGADGVNSMVAKSLNWSTPQCGVALEVEISLNNQVTEYTHRVDFDFNVLPEGYGWVFPKKSHLSCGVFTLHRSCPDIRALYNRYIKNKSFAGDISNSSLSGHFIPLKPVSSKLNRARVMLAGDAAGLADPLTGEGISFAILSGKMAAKAILQSNQNLNHYSEEVADTLAAEIRTAGFLARVLYSTPSFLYRALARKEFFADQILDLFAGKTTYRELIKKVLLKPYKLL